MKVPPAAIISVNGPPLTEISRIPPSKPVSRFQRWRNESCELPDGIPMLADVSWLSLTLGTVVAETEFGVVSGEVASLAHGVIAPWVTTAFQPGGNAGGDIASKFSDRLTGNTPRRIV